MGKSFVLKEVPTVFLKSLGLVFGSKKYYLIATISSIISLVIFVGLPAYSVPNSNISSFIATTPTYTIGFIAILSILIGIMVSMQFYTLSNNLGSKKREITTGFTSILSSLSTVVFTSATCTLCLGSLFSFLGAGSVILLMEHKLEIILLSFALMITSLYFTSLRIYDCDSCKVK